MAEDMLQHLKRPLLGSTEAVTGKSGKNIEFDILWQIKDRIKTGVNIFKERFYI